MNKARIPAGEYAKLAGDFKPVNFDADAWAALAKEAGMKYLIITAIQPFGKGPGEFGPVEIGVIRLPAGINSLDLKSEMDDTRPIEIRLVFDERSVGMSHQCVLHLKSGPNTLLVKSETRGREWRFYMQPPSLKGAVVGTAEAAPVIGLLGVPGIDAKIAELTHWLVIGPFLNEDPGLSLPHEAEGGPLIGRMHSGIDGPVTWTIPKIEVLGSITGWQPWGSLYHWSYYNGGTAWAMQVLAEATGEPRFREYANRFSDYHLEGISFV